MTNIFQMQILKKSIIKSPHEHVYQGPTKKNNDEETANIEKNNSVMRRKYRPWQIYLKCKFKRRTS